MISLIYSPDFTTSALSAAREALELAQSVAASVEPRGDAETSQVIDNSVVAFESEKAGIHDPEEVKKSRDAFLKIFQKYGTSEQTLDEMTNTKSQACDATTVEDGLASQVADEHQRAFQTVNSTCSLRPRPHNH